MDMGCGYEECEDLTPVVEVVSITPVRPLVYGDPGFDLTSPFVLSVPDFANWFEVHRHASGIEHRRWIGRDRG